MNTDSHTNNQELPSSANISDRIDSDRIDILSVELLEKHRQQADELKELARSLGLDFGWHYLLDITWILDNLGTISGKTILDAGAGTGIIQWYLAQQGATVISVDRVSRADLPLKFRRRFNVRGMRDEDLIPTGMLLSRTVMSEKPVKNKLSSLRRDLVSLTKHPSSGQVIIYNQDLSQLSEVRDGSIDAVVAVSALEHNNPDGLVQVVAELTRVLKPGSLLLATLGAARDHDWYHDPSAGWCYTDTTLRRLFQLDVQAPSNYNDYDLLFDQLRSCSELSQNLAAFYYQSGDNGMPWGIWDPAYQPVGIRKQKRGPSQ